MSEEEKLKLEYIREIIQEEIEKFTKSINRNMNVFFSVGVVLFLTLIGFQMSLTKDVQAKADGKEIERDYIRKIDYYQIEEDEHRMLLRLFSDTPTATYVFGQINDNISSSLGFKYTTRGGQTK